MASKRKRKNLSKATSSGIPPEEEEPDAAPPEPPRKSARIAIIKSVQHTSTATGGLRLREKLGAVAPTVNLNVVGIFDTELSTILTTDVETKNIVPSEPTGHDGLDYCTGCRNGGIIQQCANAECTRGFCLECVTFVPTATHPDFTCPQCWLSNRNTHSERYPHSYNAVISTREIWALNDTTPLTILSIKLSSISSYDTPSHAVYAFMQTYLRHNVNIVELDFCFDTEKSINDYERQMEKLWPAIQQGHRFMVFIATHSNPESGYIHVVKDNGGCTPFGEAAEILIPQKLRSLLAESKQPNICAIIACGGILEYHESASSLQALSMGGVFKHVFASTQRDFQGAFAASFYCAYAMNYFVRHLSYIPRSLMNCPDFGAHSGLVHFCDGLATRYEWSHGSRRPLGNPVPLQCPGCGCLRTWKSYGLRDKGHKTAIQAATIRCRRRNCKTTLEFTGLGDRSRLVVHGDLDSEDGAWLSYHFDIPELSSEAA